MTARKHPPNHVIRPQQARPVHNENPTTDPNVTYPAASKFELRLSRHLRLLRRVREAPARFLFWKARQALVRPIWNAGYRLNTTRLGNLILRDLTFTGSKVPQGPGVKVFRRDFDQVSSELLRRNPQHVSAAIERGERAASHRINVLGFGEIELGPTIDWQRDYVSGATWAKTAALRLDYVRPWEHSDVKVPWEIGRLQFLPWLGQSWLFSRRPEFVDSAKAIFDDWNRQNPVGIGIGWSCPMDVAIRGMNLIATAALLWDELDAKTRAALWHSLEVHLGYLRRHPELSDINGNHYLVDLAGIVQLGLVLNGDAPVPAWLDNAISTFSEETIQQVHADGVHLEHSTNYHRLVTEIVLLTIVEMRRAEVPISRDLWSTAGRMVGFLSAVAGEDGNIPLIADSDTGQSVIWGASNPNDVRPLLAVGATLFPDDADRRLSTPAEAMWMLGTHVADSVGIAKAVSSRRIFEDSGFGVLTRGSSKVVARSGPAGLGGRGGHDHSDLTSFTANLLGRPVIVDPGSSTYTGSRDVRRREISAAGHNMVVIDGYDPAPVVTGSVMDVVSPRARGRFEDPPHGEDLPTSSLSMTHNGFLSAPRVEGYHRNLLLSKDGRSLECVEILDGEGTHSVESYLYFDPAWSVVRTGERGVELSDAGMLVNVELDAAWTDIAIEPAMIAPRYGELVDSTRLRMRANIKLPARIVNTIRAR